MPKLIFYQVGTGVFRSVLVLWWVWIMCSAGREEGRSSMEMN